MIKRVNLILFLQNVIFVTQHRSSSPPVPPNKKHFCCQLRGSWPLSHRDWIDPREDRSSFYPSMNACQPGLTAHPDLRLQHTASWHTSPISDKATQPCVIRLSAGHRLIQIMPRFRLHQHLAIRWCTAQALWSGFIWLLKAKWSRGLISLVPFDHLLFVLNWTVF